MVHLPSIPLVDLSAQHREVHNEIDAVFRDVVERSAFIGGRYVDSFEQEFASYCGTRHAVGCASGTDALKLALLAAGINRDEEVITTPLTFIATVEAMTQIGAFPAFVDIDGATFNLSPDCLQAFLETDCVVETTGRVWNKRTGRRIVAIMPVHLYGQLADLDAIGRIARHYDLLLVEDACQAHGAKNRAGQRAGSIGVAGAFSFYPGKNLGAMGEAGAIVTNDDAMASRMKLLREHGSHEKYTHVTRDGWNGRLDALQGAILGVKLKRLDSWNARRRQVAEWYDARLAAAGIQPPARNGLDGHVNHLYVIRVPERSRLMRDLHAQGIGVGVHYPIPLHLQPAYADMGFRVGEFPVAEACAQSVLSLPMHPHLTEEQADRVCSRLLAGLSELALASSTKA